MVRRVVAAFGTWAVLAVVGPVSAQDPSPLEAADAAYDEGDLEAAREGYGDALTRPGNTPETIHRIRLRLGIIAAAFGEGDSARTHFRVALALDPNTPPPSELGPPQRVPFEEARDETGPLELELETPAGVRDEGPTELLLRASPTLRLLAASVRVSAGDWTRSVTLDGVPSLVVPEEAWTGPRLVLVADALDAHEGRLLRRSVELAPGARRPGRPATNVDDDERGGVSPWVWVVLGVVVVGAAITAAVLATSPRGLRVDSIAVTRMSGDG